MEEVGEILRSSTCRNCGRPIQLVRWYRGDEWSHTDLHEHQGGMQGPYCAGQKVAQPVEES